MKDRAYSHRTRGLARYGFLIVLAFALAACDGGAMAPSLGDPVVLPSAAVSPTASPSPTTSTTPTPTPSTTPTATEVPPNSVPVTNPEPWPVQLWKNRRMSVRARWRSRIQPSRPRGNTTTMTTITTTTTMTMMTTTMTMMMR